MKKIVAFTSMNRQYYEQCGWLMAKSYQQHMIDKIPLFLYNEDFTIAGTDIVQVGWNLGSEYNNFVNRWTKNDNQRIVTFGKKAYSIIHAMKNVRCDWLIWFDADCIIKKPFDEHILKDILKDDILSAHFGVWHEQNGKEYYSCETGFFALNKNHPLFSLFASVYGNMYNKDQYQNLRRFYDGEVYGETVSILNKTYKADMLDLSPSGRKVRTPIPRSILAPYLSHFKAGLKDTIVEQVTKD